MRDNKRHTYITVKNVTREATSVFVARPSAFIQECNAPYCCGQSVCLSVCPFARPSYGIAVITR